MRYHLTTKGGSLPAQEAIIEEENEANLPAFVGPLDPQPYLKLVTYGFQTHKPIRSLAV